MNCKSNNLNLFCKSSKISRATVAAILFVLLAGFTAQAQNISVKVEKVTLKTLFEQIERSSAYRFNYLEGTLPSTADITVNIQNRSVESVLNTVLPPRKLTFTRNGNIFAIRGIQPSGTPRTVTGTITDEKGEPIIGANVAIKGTTHGTITDIDGKFILEAASGDILHVTYVGFENKEIPVGNQSTLSVKMNELSQALNEVVVVGYGAQKKVNLTGAVVAVPVEEMGKRQVGQTSLALQGLAPGVVVTQRSGQPGRDGGTISIRGKTTLNNNGALMLVDGVEMGIDNIDPNLIESVSVLKDAASAAIYGSRAANGVILVTTKRARSDQFNIQYNGYVGFQSLSQVPQMVGAIDHMTLINEAYTNTGKSPLYSADYINEYRAGMKTNPDRYPDTRWFDQVLTGGGFQQNHFLTISGGSQRIRTVANFGYLDQNGVTENTNFKRYTFRVNNDMEVLPNLTAKIDAQFIMTDLKEPSRLGEAFHWAGRIPAIQAGVLSTGQWGEGWNGDNPIAFTRDGGLRTVRKPEATLNAGLIYKPIKQLTIAANYAPRYSESHNSAFSKIVQTYKYDGSPFYKSPQKSSLTAGTDRYLRNLVTASVTYEETYKEAHNLKVMAGYQQEDERYDGTSGYRENFAFQNYPVLSAGSEANQKAYGTAYEWALQSFFGRLNYNYKERYLFEANVRYDGSSRFYTGNKWGAFPSFSAGWRISEEAFWEKIRPVVNNLKVRGSWGQLGNNNVGNYPFSSDVNLTLKYLYNELPVSGAGVTALANKNISWETTSVTDIGFDVTLLNKINVSADYFYKVTDDILLNLDIPLIVGMGAPAQNAGKVENQGWEVNIGYMDQWGDFKFKADFNISDAKNKILDLKGVSQTSLTVNNEGQEMYSLFGYRAVGYITPADYRVDENGKSVYTGATQFGNFGLGDIKYFDKNGDGAITPADMEIMGGTIPRYTYGLNLYGEYKGFDLSMMWQGVGQANGYINGQGIMSFVMGGTVQEQQKDRNQPALGIYDAKFPRYAFNESNNEANSSFWVKDASYLRLKNIQLGYTFPKKWMAPAKIKNLRVYVSSENLLTIDRFWDCYDVEAPVGNGGFYPAMRTFSFGVNLGF